MGEIKNTLVGAWMVGRRYWAALAATVGILLWPLGIYGQIDTALSAEIRMTAWLGPNWPQIVMDSWQAKLAMFAIAIAILLVVGRKAVVAERRKEERAIQAAQSASALPLFIERRNIQVRDLDTLARYIEDFENYLVSARDDVRRWHGDEQICLPFQNHPASLSAPKAMPSFSFEFAPPKFEGTIVGSMPTLSPEQPPAPSGMHRPQYKLYDPKGPENEHFKRAQAANLQHLETHLIKLKQYARAQEAHLANQNSAIATRLTTVDFTKL